jgi:hypothetical protein
MLKHDVGIFSNARKSEMFGAQYLHDEITGLTPRRPEFAVAYILNGKAEDYAAKVYGETPPDFVSPDSLEGEHPGWDIRRAYDVAWEMYEDNIFNTGKLTAAKLREAVDSGLLKLADLVISTIPAPDICYRSGEHSFTARDAWAIGDAPERGVECPVTVLRDSVVCDGTDAVGWYRASNVAGYRTAEWPEQSKPPLEGIARVTKVVRTNCDCWRAEGFWRTGRYGAWDKKLFTHHAYWSILSALKEVGR